jgi:hypothetical protein
MMTADHVRIFLSHRHQDEALADVVAGELQRLAGPALSVWRPSDVVTAGGDWASETKDALARADAMIVLITEAQADWTWVLFEVGRFTDPTAPVPRPVIPLFGAASDLPRPLQDLQGVPVEHDHVLRFLEMFLETDEIIPGPLVADIPDSALDDAARTIVDAWHHTPATSWSPAVGTDEHAVFLSYRRADSAHVCGRIWDRLTLRYGPDAVFRDVDSIPLGVDFRAWLQDAVSQSRLMLVAIGPDWLTVSDDAGRPRLENPDDFVRVEVESALSINLPIIPLLVRGASMPREGELPPSVDGLRFRNGLVVRADPDFEWDMDRLKSGIEAHGINPIT